METCIGVESLSHHVLGFEKQDPVVRRDQLVPPFEIFSHPHWNSSQSRPCRVTREVIDKVPEPSHKHEAQPHVLGTKREESNE